MLGKCAFFIALLSSSVILLLFLRAKEIDSDEESEESETISSSASFETESSTSDSDSLAVNDVAGFEASSLSSNSTINLRHFIEVGTVTSYFRFGLNVGSTIVQILKDPTCIGTPLLHSKNER